MYGELPARLYHFVLSAVFIRQGSRRRAECPSGSVIGGEQNAHSATQQQMNKIMFEMIGRSLKEGSAGFLLAENAMMIPDSHLESGERT